MFDPEVCSGGTPYIQVLADGRCILTFDFIPGVALPSLADAIAWCSEHLKHETPDSEIKKTLEYLLIDADPARSTAEAELQADLIMGLFSAWAYCVRCRPARKGRCTVNVN
jgi:hypothetical protein